MWALGFRAQPLLHMECVVGGRSLTGVLKAGETLRNVLPTRFIGFNINIFTTTFISTFLTSLPSNRSLLTWANPI